MDERKVVAMVQARYGPMVTGPRGLLQPVMDGVKLIGKEDIIPAKADRWVFTLAPFIILYPHSLYSFPCRLGSRYNIRFQGRASLHNCYICNIPGRNPAGRLGLK